MSDIAKWNGAEWSSLGPHSPGTIYDLAGFEALDDGPMLYAGGSFGGPLLNGIAMWDGISWSGLDSGLIASGNSGTAYALLAVEEAPGTAEPAITVGGCFDTAGSVSANRIAIWNGAVWSAVGSGVAGFAVWTLAASRASSGDGPMVYAGGDFWQAGGETVNDIAKWDGTTWSALGTGLSNGTVRHLAEFTIDPPGTPALFVGGAFDAVDGLPANGIATWRGCAAEPTCDFEDLNCDGVINVSDLLILLSNWGLCAAFDDCPADLNDDGAVDVSDLLILLANWG